MKLSFTKIGYLQTMPYRVFTDDETHTGTATVHCRNDNGTLRRPSKITVLTDTDFAATEDDVVEEYTKLMKSGELE